MDAGDAGSLRIDARTVLLTPPLARGATANVHLGRITTARGGARTVAIKRLHPHLAADPKLRGALVEEGRLAALVRHPNVVQVIDVVEPPAPATREAGDVLLVMEYVPGETLHHLMERGGRPPAAVAVAIVRDVLHGLHAAHHARGPDGAPLGLVHRDVSPRNVLVGEDGTARLLDFGIARAHGQRTTTREGFVRGTLAYMPPEQLHGDALTARSDLYAAGVLLWEALTGERLFAGETEAAIIARILDHDVRPASSVASGVPRELDHAILRGLSRSPAERFASGLEMALAVERGLVPAPRAAVAEWVAGAAGDALAERRALAQAADALTAAARDAPPPRAARGARLARGVALAAIGIAAIGAAVTRDPTMARREDGVAWSRAASHDQPRTPPETTESAAPPPPGPSVPPAATSAPPRRARDKAPEPLVDAGSPVPGGAPRCLPYYVDDAGRRRFDRACLQ